MPRGAKQAGVRACGGRAAGAFTLVELLIVIGIIAVLLSILVPGVGRATYLSRSARCGANKDQIHVGMQNYASANEGMYPCRYAKKNTYNHAYWFGKVGQPEQDVHEVFERYVGEPVGNSPPEVLLCAVAPTGIWGVDIPWPMGGIYRTNVMVYAGYNWADISSDACVPHAPLDEMPQGLNQAPDRPIAGDLIEYMSDNSSMGYSGWDTPHAYSRLYHDRIAGGPEKPPPDPIPFAYADGSVRFTRNLEACYTDMGWGTNFWPVP